MRPLIPRPVSVRQIVLTTEHSGALLVADVWNHGFFFSHAHFVYEKLGGRGLGGEEIQFSEHRNELVDKRRIWMTRKTGCGRGRQF